MKRIIATLSAALMLLSFSACTGGEDTPTNSKAPTGANDTKDVNLTVSYDFASGEKCASDGSCYFKYSTNRATLTEGCDKASVEKINAALDEAYDSLQSELDETAEYAKQLSDEGANLPFEYSFDTQVMRGDANVLSIAVDAYAYTGGVHGMSGRTVLNFDPRTGERLYFPDLGKDRDALSDFVLDYITQLAKGYSGYEAVTLSLLPDLIENEQWYFTETGLMVYADAYQVASYAAGRMGFLVPYEELSGKVLDKYIPVYGTDSDAEMKADVSNAEGSENHTVVGSAVVDADGQEVLLTTSGKVYDLRIYYATLADGGMQLVRQRDLFYRSSLDTSEGVTVTVYIPDAYCNVVVSYMTADGGFVRMGIFQSGEDGSVYLAPCDDLI